MKAIDETQLLVIERISEPGCAEIYAIQTNMNKDEFILRSAMPGEVDEIGKLVTQIYLGQEDVPKEYEQSDYSQVLANIETLVNRPGAEILVAVSPDGRITGAVVCFSEV
jgi:hypothetical protein